MGTKFEPYLCTMSQHLAEEYSVSSLAAFLYGGSICVSTFGSKVGSAENGHLVAMLSSMTTSFFTEFNGLDKFEKKPDIVEEFFYLMGTVTSTSPLIFMQTMQSTSTVYEAGIVGLQMKHRDAHRGILNFFEKVINIVSPNNKKNTSTAEIQQAVMTKVLDFGGRLVSALVMALSGLLTLHTLGGTRPISKLFLELWDVSKFVSETLFQEWLSTAVYALPAAPQKVAVDMNLISVAGASDDECYRQLDKFFQRNK